MEKSADAFRTISEVAEDLALPQHVLRFWETRFPQIRPLKRAGGRRYYRPADVLLLRAIRQLLYDDGYTIKGVQRLLKEQGARGLRTSESAPAFAEGETDPMLEEAEDHAPSDVPLPADEPPPAAPLDASSHPSELTRDREGLAEALSLVEDCARILLALRRVPG